KGLAIATTAAGAFLYAADFHNARVDVFDGSFHPVTTPGGFADPDLPVGFAPFGIQNLQGLVYVTYAQQDADAEDEIAGPGLGCGNGANAGPATTLFFAAGPDDETHGLFGSITAQE